VLVGIPATLEPHNVVGKPRIEMWSEVFVKNFPKVCRMPSAAK